MNIAIVEDMTEDRQWLSQKIKLYLESNQLHASLYEYSCTEDFIASLSDISYQIVFMDIYFDGMSGMDAAVQLRQLDSNCKLVFLTCTADYALQGYSVQASHYLLKPISDEKFIEAMKNCKLEPANAVPYLNLAPFGNHINLDTRQIQYIHLESRTVHIHTSQKVYSVNGAFSRVTEPLTSDRRFLLCIQGIMVNMDYISGHEDTVFILKDGKRIPINLRYKRRILQQYRNYIFENMGGES